MFVERIDCGVVLKINLEDYQSQCPSVSAWRWPFPPDHNLLPRLPQNFNLYVSPFQQKVKVSCEEILMKYLLKDLIGMCKEYWAQSTHFEDIDVGDMIDVMDTRGVWCIALVGIKGRTGALVMFPNWSILVHSEWIAQKVWSERVAKSGSRSKILDLYVKSGIQLLPPPCDADWPRHFIPETES